MKKEEILRYITFKLTNKCNLNCKMCGQVYSTERNNEELSFDIIKSCLDNTDTIEHVYLFGGEPLLYSHIEEVLQLIKKKNLPALMTTNGMFLERHAKSIVMEELRDIDISIDSHDETTFSNIRINGRLNKVIENLTYLFELKKKYNSLYPRVGISCVILPDNYKNLIDYYQFFIHKFPDLYHIVFEFPMQTSEICGKATNTIYESYFQAKCESWKNFYNKIEKFTEEQLKEVYAQLKELSKHPKVSIKGSYDKIPIISTEVMKHNRCDYPFSTITILENAKATFCVDYPDILIGDLLMTTLKDIWNGEQATKYRNYMNTHGFFPICTNCCHFKDIIWKDREMKII